MSRDAFTKRYEACQVRPSYEAWRSLASDLLDALDAAEREIEMLRAGLTQLGGQRLDAAMRASYDASREEPVETP